MSHPDQFRQTFLRRADRCQRVAALCYKTFSVILSGASPLAERGCRAQRAREAAESATRGPNHESARCVIKYVAESKDLREAIHCGLYFELPPCEHDFR
jgi:hypothetical protein